MIMSRSTPVERRGGLGRRTVRLAFVIAALPAAVLAAGANGYRVNFTPSEPLGLWRIRPLDRPVTTGDMVFVCTPQTPIMQEARKRGYLGRGLCPGRTAPLIKSVVAREGKRVEIGRNVTIDGAELDHSELERFDGLGRTLKPTPGGRVPAGHVFLHSPYKGSFDSRYFGPVPDKGVLGLADQVLTYAP